MTSINHQDANKLVTIKDVARVAGVSYSTVSRALNDYPGTNQATKDKIKKIADEMGYSTNQVARSLVTKRSKTIGFVLPDLSNPFFTDILSAINKQVSNSGYDLLICETHWQVEREKEELTLLLNKGVDGIILYPTEAVKIDRTKNIFKPMVVFGDAPNADSDNQSHFFIGVNNFEAGYFATTHMIECGYRKPVFLGGPYYSHSSRMRLYGVKSCLEDNLMKDRLQDEYFISGKYTIESGRKRTLEYLTSVDELPDSFICGNDLIALGCISAIEEMGFTVADQIGVIGFDDIAYADLPQIQLTTIRIPREEMGRLSVDFLLEILSDGKDPEIKRASKMTMLSPRLIKRNTTALLKRER